MLASVTLPARAVLATFLVVACALFWPSQAAWAIPTVERHNLDCGNTFPCPEEIRRRVDFWVHVFRSWSTDQVIFHDTHHPERVYSVVRTDQTCRRRRAGRKVEKERRRIRTQLNRLAGKIDQQNPKLSKRERQLLALFPDKNKKTIQRAAANIRCQQGNRDRFLDALQRYGAYRGHILKVLRESNLSEDIVYLPFVESAYNPKAYSWVGAAGLWQIMPRTARKLGLQLNATIDERFDPEAATWAAARYLSNSTQVLTEAARKKNPNVSAAEVNPFVITSYNYGVAGMRRAIENVGPDYVDVLNKYRSRSFRVAVKNFYASFLAARHVARNADKYFDRYDTAPPLRYSSVVLKRPTSVKRIRKVFGVDIKTLKRLNPALTRYVWKGWRLVPDGYTLRLPSRKDNWRRQVAYIQKLEPEEPGLSGAKYVVQRGDTACGIANVFNIRCRDLIQVNRLGRNALIRVGQKLDIPARPGGRKPVQVASAKQAVPVKTGAKQKRTGVASAGTTARDTVAAVHTSKKKLPEWQVKAEPIKVAGKQDTSGSPVMVQTAKAETIETQKGPSGTPSSSASEKPAMTAKEVFKALNDRIDVAVHVGQVNGTTVFSIIAEPEETLGHYADWLGLRGTGQLRRLNGINRSRRLQTGQRVILPIPSHTKRDAFEASRLEYHRTLVDEFQQHYKILGVEYYVVKRGDSMWRIAGENELPYWVLTRLNPGKRTPAIGERLVLPVSKARKPSEEAPVHQPG